MDTKLTNELEETFRNFKASKGIEAYRSMDDLNDLGTELRNVFVRHDFLHIKSSLVFYKLYELTVAFVQDQFNSKKIDDIESTFFNLLKSLYVSSQEYACEI